MVKDKDDKKYSKVEEKSGILNANNGLIEFHIGKKFFKDEPDKIMLLGTKTKDGTYFLQLDNFDVYSLWQVLDKLVMEIKATND